MTMALGFLERFRSNQPPTEAENETLNIVHQENLDLLDSWSSEGRVDAETKVVLTEYSRLRNAGTRKLVFHDSTGPKPHITAALDYLERHRSR